MKMPKSPETMAWYREFVAGWPQVECRPMFGQVAGFVDGQMTGGTFGTEVNMRLGEADRREFMERYGARVFEPMEGRPMKEYVVVPEGVRADSEVLKGWMERSVRYAESLPPKGAGVKKKR
jgi:TfoX/Sxy family transcriptional regulator of competence genes